MHSIYFFNLKTMNNQLKILRIVAILGSFSMGCQKENIQPANQINQPGRMTTNAGGRGGSPINTPKSSPINIPKNSKNKISSSERAAWKNTPNALRGFIQNNKWYLRQKDQNLARSFSVIKEMKETLARRKDFQKELTKVLSIANEKKGLDREYQKIDYLSKEIREQQSIIDIIQSAISDAERTYKIDTEQHQSNKEEHEGYEDLLAEIMNE